jgi:hypothetical protein
MLYKFVELSEFERSTSLSESAMHETGFISRLFDGGDIRVVQTANKFKRN